MLTMYDYLKKLYIYEYLMTDFQTGHPYQSLQYRPVYITVQRRVLKIPEVLKGKSLLICTNKGKLKNAVISK